MSEPGDFVPPPEWRKHDFKTVRQEYDEHAGRSYRKAVSEGKAAIELIEPRLETLCMSAVALRVDQTDSMDGWQAVIVSKFPYLEYEAKSYFGEDFAISPGAFGDAHNNERYPLQIRKFSRGPEFKQLCDELIMEKKGGGQVMEDSQLAALYDARNVSMPNATHPLWIAVTDEMPHEDVSPEHAAKYLGIKLNKPMYAEEIFAELKRKWSRYVILKPYGNTRKNEMDSINRRIYDRWEKLVGADHIALLDVPERVVDVIFGIFAKEVGKVPYYYEELKERQTPEQVEQATKALKTIHAQPLLEHKPAGHTGKSVMFRPKK